MCVCVCVLFELRVRKEAFSPFLYNHEFWVWPVRWMWSGAGEEALAPLRALPENEAPPGNGLRACVCAVLLVAVACGAVCVCKERRRLTAAPMEAKAMPLCF